MELSVRSLKHFILRHWTAVETEPFINGYHLDMICEHLEAVSSGELTRLMINIPPRHMKSLSVAVFWPMWHWIKYSPSFQWLFASYAHTLSIRDSVKCRNLFYSQPYQEMLNTYQPDLVLRDDQNTKVRWENMQGGYRLSTSVEGALTGEGGDCICVDDPHNVIQGESEADRDSVLRWWDESMSTRLNNPKTGRYVIIMQRVHENDLCGHILETASNDWVHLCLPARYESESRIFSPLVEEDPRKEEGEPLWPARFGDKELKAIEKGMTEYAIAGQLQQRPAPRGGGMFPVERIKVIDNVESKKVLKKVRYWDKAGTAGGGAFSVGVKMLLLEGNEFVIEDVVRGQWDASDRERRIKQTADIDGIDTIVYVEQEPGSGGKESAQATVRNLKGFRIYVDPVGQSEGNKTVRAEPYAAQVQNGSVSMLRKEWNRDYLSELEMFPAGKYKDQVDGSSGAFNKLTETKKTAGTWGDRGRSRLRKKKQVRKRH